MDYEGRMGRARDTCTGEAGAKIDEIVDRQAGVMVTTKNCFFRYSTPFDRILLLLSFCLFAVIPCGRVCICV